MAKDPELHCSILPFGPFALTGEDGPTDVGAQLSAFEEISEQIYELLIAAYRNKADRWQPVRIIIQAEKLIAEYTAEGFHLLIPLAEVLHQLFRAERRIFIRRALLSREKDRPIYREALRRWGCDVDAADDFTAVERALNEGADMFADLRRVVR